MKIQYLQQHEIDKTKWNSCIHYAINGNIFGYMWMLDAVTREWDALVVGDYETVLPLPYRLDVLGRKKVFQPELARELGVYSIKFLSKARIQAILEAIPEEFRSIEITLNEQLLAEDFEGFEMESHTNHQLPLMKPYEEIADGFSRDLLLSLEKTKAALRPAGTLKPEKIADFYQKYNTTHREKKTNFHALQRIMWNALHRGWGFSSGVTDQEGNLLAVDFFLTSHSKVVSLLPTASPAGEKVGAPAFLINLFLHNSAGKPSLLDFNTNTENALAKSFGAETNTYRTIRKGKRFLGLFSMLFAVLFMLTSCGKEKVTANWETIETNTDYDLEAIHFIDENRGYVAGGFVWHYGELLSTEDGGKTWQKDSISSGAIFDLTTNNSNQLHAVGAHGLLLQQQTSDWESKRFYDDYTIWNDIALNTDNQGLICGGASYGSGEIIAFSDWNTPTIRHYFDHEISAVTFSSDSIAHAVGYGIILRSTDAGLTWQPSSTNGDFFRDVCFPTEQIGYIIGNSGSILKTEDAGLTWQTLRAGGKVFVKDFNFRAVDFSDQHTGYIVGDKGTCWKIEAGGADWTVIDNLPDINFRDVQIVDNQVFIVGQEGRMLKFK